MQDAGIARRIVLKIADYFPIDDVIGWPLIAAALVALVWANSPWGSIYQELWSTKVTIGLGIDQAEMDLKHLVNELLMPLFFFVVGLEVKHAVTIGELSSWKTAAMPACIGLGGIVVPAILYLSVNAWGGNLHGWAVPVATDIAFALAILVTLGERVPAALKELTLAFAAVDDIAGVLAIAFFYSQAIFWIPLAVAGGLILVIIGLRQLYVRGIMAYVLLGLGVFAAMSASGVHTTIAGVLLGLIVSARPNFSREEFCGRAEKLLDDFRHVHRHRVGLEEKGGKTWEEYEELEAAREEEELVLARLDSLTAGTEAPVERAMRLANPWVSYLVLPLFALANAGFTISTESVATALTSFVAWGIFAGLLLGKPIGILSGAYLASRAGVASLPKGVTWRSLTGMSLLAGIGFTVSLFIAELAFPEPQQLRAAKLAILAATLLAAFLGATVLFVRAAADRQQ